MPNVPYNIIKAIFLRWLFLLTTKAVNNISFLKYTNTLLGTPLYYKE